MGTNADRLSWRACAAALAAFSAIAIALTWPLLLRLSSAVPHDLGDPLFSATVLWWNSHVVPLTTRWWNGFFFAPATGTIAFSDHDLGESLIASPLLWLGLSPAAAYNVTLLATFPLSALAAYWLGFVLTRRHDGAAVCGLAFGFTPYRLAHIEHLQLLAAYGMPAALAALHRARETRRAAWLAVFAAALLLQGLCTSYYLLFFSVFVALWVLWFVDWRDWRLATGILVAAAAAALALVPVGIDYFRIHRFYGLERDYREILRFSADMTSLATASPMLALWGWTSSLNGPERQIFPGLTIVALTVAGATAAWRRERRAERIPMLGRLRAALIVVSVVFLAVGLEAAIVGPWRIDLGFLVVAADAPFKPITVALVALVAAVAISPTGRAAWRVRSPLAFYLGAALFLFLCSFGPTPTFLGRQVLYRPPYAWLMRMPVFASGVRVPARFAMPAILALAAAGSLAYAGLTAGLTGRRLATSKRYAIAALVLAGILVDTWTTGVPLPRVPAAWPSGYAAGGAAVVELPLGEVFEDTAAMYRAALDDRPVVNGYSGYEPPHYGALRAALDAGDSSALDGIGNGRRLVIAVDEHADADGRWRALVSSHSGAVAIGDQAGWAFFDVPTTAARPPSCHAAPARIAGASAQPGPVRIADLTDGDPRTFWVTTGPQRAGDELTIELDRPVSTCGVELSLGRAAVLYPRALDVETSMDGTRWDRAWSGEPGGRTVRSALAQPTDVRVAIDFEPRPARFVRVRLDRSVPDDAWLVTDVTVRGDTR